MRQTSVIIAKAAIISFCVKLTTTLNSSKFSTHK